MAGWAWPQERMIPNLRLDETIIAQDADFFVGCGSVQMLYELRPSPIEGQHCFFAQRTSDVIFFNHRLHAFSMDDVMTRQFVGSLDVSDERFETDTTFLRLRKVPMEAGMIIGRETDPALLAVVCFLKKTSPAQITMENLFIAP